MLITSSTLGSQAHGQFRLEGTSAGPTSCSKQGSLWGQTRLLRAHIPSCLTCTFLQTLLVSKLLYSPPFYRLAVLPGLSRPLDYLSAHVANIFCSFFMKCQNCKLLQSGLCLESFLIISHPPAMSIGLLKFIILPAFLCSLDDVGSKKKVAEEVTFRKQVFGGSPCRLLMLGHSFRCDCRWKEVFVVAQVTRWSTFLLSVSPSWCDMPFCIMCHALGSPTAHALLHHSQIWAVPIPAPGACVLAQGEMETKICNKVIIFLMACIVYL